MYSGFDDGDGDVCSCRSMVQIGSICLTCVGAFLLNLKTLCSLLAKGT